MKVEEIYMENFRCFKDISVTFHPEMTVLIAPNGAGKTTVLDAIRIAFWPFVKAFDLGSQAGKSATIQTDDVRVARTSSGMEPQLPSFIRCYGNWSMKEVDRCWTQTRPRIKKGTNTLADAETKKLTEMGKSLQESVRNCDI